jgi:DNA-binding transcriptional LysR family regulator
LLEHAETAALAAKRVAQGEIGSVAISFVASAVYEFLPRVIAQAQRERPEIAIALQEMNTFDQLEALRARRIDLGIVRAPMARQGFASECLIREPFLLAAPARHPLASQDALTIGALDKQPFIMYSHAAWQPFNELLTGMFRSASVTPDYVQFLGSTLTILALVNAGMGLALVPRSASMVRFESVVFRPITLAAGICSELHLVWRDDNDNPAFRVMLEAIRHSVSNL